MYFVLNWTTQDGVDPDEVLEDIREAIDEKRFVNVTELTDDCLAANVRQGGGRGVGDVFDLEEELREVSPQRFVFLLTYAARGNLILHSGDFDDDALEEIADY